MNTLERMAAVVGLLVVVAGSPVPATEGGPVDPIDLVQQSTRKHTEVLTDLSARIPEEAGTGLAKAIAASRKGQEAALAALARSRSGDLQSGARGVERAREKVAAAFARSVLTLQGLLGTLPEQAVDRHHVTEALERVQEHRQVALDNLDRLIADLRPGSPSTNAPEGPESPGAPARPERPERPDRPAIPERPEAPDRPERPEPPERPIP